MRKDIVRSIIFAILFLIVLIVVLLSKFLTDFYWFDVLGFKQIFLITLSSKIILFFVGMISFIIFVGINIWISSKLNNDKSTKKFSNIHKKSNLKNKKIISKKLIFLILILISLFFGSLLSSNWFTVLQYMKHVQFNVQDPIFAKDVSFYIFELPFYNLVWRFSMLTMIVTSILVLLNYLKSFIADLFKPRQQSDPLSTEPGQPFNFKDIFSKFKRRAIVHIGFLITFIFILLGVMHYLSRFSIMFSESGIVVGAGYADVVAFLPIVKILMVFAILLAIVMLIWIFYISKKPKLRKRHILLYAISIYLLFFFIGPTIIPGIVQALIVAPNELNLEAPYIQNNIKFTKMAYGLTEVEGRAFSVQQNIDSALLEKESETINNVRILDYRPLTKTYKQTQEIRLYYDLSQIDIDRYDLNGEYRQVMIAPRELDHNQVADNAKTWVNLHMVYTHGYGVVMSPVNEVTDQGLPQYIVKDIPPSYTLEEDALYIDKPQIYYGEHKNDYVFVNSNAQEFDYPKGDGNVYTDYDGKGGVVLDSFLKKILFAIRFSDIKILLSSDLTQNSKIMFIRNIQERIKKITPFIGLDEDPYLVIHEGRLKWIQDAYTITGNFPYSEKRFGLNYIRNSVKIVIDAYDGDVTYFVTDTNDPLIMTYSKIFPKQFRSIDIMPQGLITHIRYPVDLFMIQADIYNTYHMEDVTVFYNKEDAWQVPSEVYGVGQRVNVEPYYIIMKLPGEAKEEFVLMSSFTPIKKDNMISWMAARSDGENYGKLILFKFPKDKLVYGPLQIEAKIDQDSEISEQLTLWSQQGSRVTRGNLLVIPIQDSILYIEPLYIQAETGQLPELKRVLVSDGTRVVMEQNLGDALKVLFGSTIVRKKIDVEETVDKSVEDLIVDANEYYNAIQDSMSRNDWEGIGENFDKLGEILNNLNS